MIIPAPGYNLYACVLVAILDGPPLGSPAGTPRRGKDLDSLDDDGFDPYANIFEDNRIAPEIVRRLKRSLVVAGQFPILSRKDMLKIKKTYALNPQEMLILNAAVLATGIEAKLYPRVDIEIARGAAEKLLPLLEEALKTMQDDEYIGAIQRGPTAAQADETEIDRRCGPALDAIDRAMLHLGVVEDGLATPAQYEELREAVAAFQLALKLLKQADEALQQTSAWKYWFAYAQQGLADSLNLLPPGGFAALDGE